MVANKFHKRRERTSIEYISKEIPPFQPSSYSGSCYEILVPDTLDLTERVSLAVNGLTAPINLEADYELYRNCQKAPPLVGGEDVI